MILSSRGRNAGPFGRFDAQGGSVGSFYTIDARGMRFVSTEGIPTEGAAEKFMIPLDGSGGYQNPQGDVLQGDWLQGDQMQGEGVSIQGF